MSARSGYLTVIEFVIVCGTIPTISTFKSKAVNLQGIVAGLVIAQKNFDNKAYAKYFSEKAVVSNEGRNHTGKREYH